MLAILFRIMYIQNVQILNYIKDEQINHIAYRAL